MLGHSTYICLKNECSGYIAAVQCYCFSFYAVTVVNTINQAYSCCFLKILSRPTCIKLKSIKSSISIERIVMHIF